MLRSRRCYRGPRDYHTLFIKFGRAGGQTRDLLIFVYFLSTAHRLRPLGYCSPLAITLSSDGNVQKIVRRQL